MPLAYRTSSLSLHKTCKAVSTGLFPQFERLSHNRYHNPIRLTSTSSQPHTSASNTSPTMQHSLDPGSTPQLADGTDPELPNKPMSVSERDARIVNAWKDREGSLANAEFENGQVEEGYRKNVKANIFRYI